MKSHLITLSLALQLAGGAFAQDCIVEYLPNADLSPFIQGELLGKTEVNGDMMAVTVLAPIGATGVNALSRVRIMERDAQTGRYTEIADIDVPGSVGTGYTPSAQVAIAEDVMVISEPFVDGNILGQANVFYRVPNIDPTAPDNWFHAGGLNASTSATALPTEFFGREISLLTIQDRTLLYVGDPGISFPGTAINYGALWVFEVTSPGAVPVGGFTPPPVLTVFNDPATNIIRGFGESVDTSLSSNPSFGRVITSSTVGDAGQGRIYFYDVALLGTGAGFFFVHSSVPTAGSQGLVDPNTRGLHLSVSDDLAYVQVEAQVNAAGTGNVPGWTEVYTRSGGSFGSGLWTLDPALQFEGRNALISEDGSRSVAIDAGFGSDDVLTVTVDEAAGLATLGNPRAPAAGGLGETISEFGASSFQRLLSFDCDLGLPFCESLPNSTGMGSTIFSTGSTVLADNALGMLVTQLPPNQFGFMLASRNAPTINFIPQGSTGLLCLGQPIVRLNQLSEIENSGAAGIMEFDIDVNSINAQTMGNPVLVGETWRFQCWHRDVAPDGSPNSGLSNGVAVLWR